MDEGGRVFAEDMCSEQAAGVWADQNLAEAVVELTGEAHVAVGIECFAADVGRVIGDKLVFRCSEAGDFGCGENGVGHWAMVNRQGIVVESVSDEEFSLEIGAVAEHVAANAVSQCPHVLGGGVEMAAGEDESIGVDFDAGGIKAKIVGGRSCPGGDEERLDAECRRLATIYGLEGDVKGAAVVPYSGGEHPFVDGLIAGELLGEGGFDLGVCSSEKFAADDEVGVGAEGAVGALNYTSFLLINYPMLSGIPLS